MSGLEVAMSPALRTVAVALVAGYAGLCIYAGVTQGREVRNTLDYVLASKNVGFLFLFFTCWASFSGAGNFIGYAGRGALQGISAYWLYLGEILAGYAIFGYVLAPYLARFSYFSMPHYLAHYLVGGDPVTRALAGTASLLPNVCWVGAQMMGQAYVWTMLLGINPKVAILMVGAIFIYYSYRGGMKAVVWTDLWQGMLQLLLAIGLYSYLVAHTRLDVGWVRQVLISQDPELWNPFRGGVIPHVSLFLVGMLGALSNPIFWNRAFMAKDVRTSRRGFGLAMTITIVAVALTVFVGLSSRAMNPNVGDKATLWFIFTQTSPWLVAVALVCVSAATMSTADTHLVAGATNIVADVLDPNSRWSDEKRVRYLRLCTVLAGVFAIGGAMIFPTILDLGMFGYAICGGVLIPLFVIGLLLRDRRSEEFRSRLSVTAARAGLVAGAVVAVLFEAVPGLSRLLGGGIIPALVVTTVITLVANVFAKPVAGGVAASS